MLAHLTYSKKLLLNLDLNKNYSDNRNVGLNQISKHCLYSQCYSSALIFKFKPYQPKYSAY